MQCENLLLKAVYVKNPLFPIFNFYEFDVEVLRKAQFILDIGFNGCII